MVPEVLALPGIDKRRRQFELLASLVRVQQGKLTLEPFQHELLTPVFGGVKSNFIEIPKKNGKSTMVALLAIHHLLTTEDADGVILASTVPQATIIYNQIRTMARAPEIAPEIDVKPGFKELRSAHNPLSRIRVIPSDPKSAEGIIPTLALFDEFHVATDFHTYAIARDGIDARGGQIIAITNSGEDTESPLGIIRQQAFDYPFQEHRGAYHCYVSKNLESSYQAYCLPDEADVNDMNVVKAANPLTNVTPEVLQGRRDDPGITLNRWKRFACGIWVRSEDTAIQSHEWDALFTDEQIPAGADVALGWDNAMRGVDFTAIVPLWWKSDSERVFGKPILLKPEQQGEMLDDRLITGAIKGFAERYNLVACVFDPNAGAAALAQQMERDGLEMVEFDQTTTNLCRADIAFLEAVRQKTIRVDRDPQFRQHALNAVAKTAQGEKWYFNRPKQGARVPTDALRAASMVLDVYGAIRRVPEPPSLWGVG